LQEQLADLLLRKQLPQTSVTALQNLLRENAALREKNSKLKSLLGRSAKAQRDAKNELEQTRRSLEATQAENDRMEKRVEVLASRPTHMDLLADFKANFDRALLSIGSGGENAAESSAGSALDSTADGMSLYDEVATPARNTYGQASSRSDSLLLTELNEAMSRIAHLESLNGSSQAAIQQPRARAQVPLARAASSKNPLANLQLELRMSRMKTEHALRGLREKEAVVAEMQLEIDLVTNSAVEANRRGDGGGAGGTVRQGVYRRLGGEGRCAAGVGAGEH
ncbi:hypothetical protein ACHAWF_014203, partial [Thalassiosira exigua]